MLCLTACTAQAEGLCDQLTAIMGKPATDGQHVTLDGNGKSDCAVSLDLSGAKALNCAWDFPFRDGTAREVFAGTLARLQVCFGADATLDQPVNHPDFYDLRVFQTELGEVGLSLKDKGALQRSYVFLRIVPAP